MIDLWTHPVFVMAIKTHGGGVFFKIENTSSDSLTDLPIKVVFPNTSGAFQHFAVDLSKLVTRPNESKAAKIVLSDTEAPMECKDRGFQRKIPADAEKLTYDGRRFLRGGKSRVGQMPQMPTPFKDLLGKINFIADNSILHTHDQVLQLRSSVGGIWAYMPLQNLNTDPLLSFQYRSPKPFSFMLELKNTDDKHLIGRNGGRVPGKIEVKLPATAGSLKIENVNLVAMLVRDVKDIQARIIVITDPCGDAEILGFGFSPKIP